VVLMEIVRDRLPYGSMSRHPLRLPSSLDTYSFAETLVGMEKSYLTGIVDKLFDNLNMDPDDFTIDAWSPEGMYSL
jgi:hypothetical protein